MPDHHRLTRITRATSATLAVVLLATGAVGSSVAQAQSSGSSGSSATDLVIGSSRSGSSDASALASSLATVDALGSADFPLPSVVQNIDPNLPREIDESIDRVEVVDKSPDADADAAALGVERWTVNSPAMARPVELQVRPAPDTSRPAPMLYLLDGVGAPTRSGWVATGVHQAMADENVTLVMPTQAPASFYLDWYADDEQLGRNQWETFLTRELPEVLATDTGINHNARTAIGGLSMGATGAITLANANPSFYDAAFGISGCYSTTSAVGYQNFRLTVESRGGDVDNLLGPAGSPQRQRYDVAADPSGLADLSVYLSAAEGEFSEEAEEKFTEATSSDAAAAWLLEQGTYSCTSHLVDSMEGNGLYHQEVDLARQGVHDWDYFFAQLEPAWEHIRPALY